MRVVVAGATGVIGSVLARQLGEQGHDVAGICRSESGARRLSDAGIEPLRLDLADTPRLRDALRRAQPEAVVDQVTGLPDAIGSSRRAFNRFYERYDALAEGARRELHAAAAEAGARRYIVQSVAFGYEPGDPQPRTETAPLYEDPPKPWDRTLPALRALERAVLTHPSAAGTVLRYGYFYGPGTNYAEGGGFHEEVRRRRFPLVGKGEGFFSFVHVEDAAAATVAALDAGPSVFNVTDDEPAAAATWLPEYARIIGAKRPRRVPAWLARLVVGPLPSYWATAQPPVSNAKARAELDWTPRYPSWRQGFAEGLGSKQ
jgi:2-alkyl-3-oxoalkanoate reductase